MRALASSAPQSQTSVAPVVPVSLFCRAIYSSVAGPLQWLRGQFFKPTGSP